MADDRPKDRIIFDPLSEVTRKERTSLLGLSILGLALVKIPLIPTKIGFLGIDFEKFEQRTFVELYSLVVAYYLVAFSLYALADYSAWRRAEIRVWLQLAEDEKAKNEQAGTPNTTKKLVPRYDRLQGETDRFTPPREKVSSYSIWYFGAASHWLGRFSSRLRALFEFLMPVAFGGYALYELLHHMPKP